MTKKISKVLLAVVTATVVLSACSKVPEQSKYIPKTAGVVLSLNSKQLTNKLVTNGFTMDKMFAAIQDKDTASEVAKAWKDAENSGIDLQNNFFMSMVYGGGANQSYVSMVGGLKDATKFEAFLKKTMPNFTLKKKSDFQYVWSENQKAVIGWNSKTVIYVSGLDMNKLKNEGMGIPGPGDQDTQVDTVAPVVSPARQVTPATGADEDTWVAETDHLFHLKKEEAVTSIEAFNSMEKNNADLGVFVNPEPIYEAQSASMTMMMMGDLKKLIEGSYYTATVNFEKGKVEVDNNSYVGKEMADIYKKYKKLDADVDMLEKYPSSNITGYLVYGFDFHILGDILKDMGYEGMANMFLRSSNLTMSDILDAFQGQMVFVGSDIANKKTSVPVGDTSYSMSKPEGKWLVAFKVGDKAAFDKVMKSPLLQGAFVKQGDHYVMQQMGAGTPAVNITDKLVVAASDNNILEQYLAGKGKAEGLDNNLISKIKGNPGGGYLDVQKLMAAMPVDELPQDSRSLVDKAKNLVKDVTLVSHNFDGKQQRSEMVINFVNQDENSLVQLVNVGTDAARYFKSKKTASTWEPPLHADTNAGDSLTQ